jgi:hypothetical protein
MSTVQRIRPTKGEVDIHPIRLLNFVRDLPGEGTGRDFWAVSSTGIHRLDWILGRELGEEALRYVRMNSETSLLGWVARDMVKRGEFGGLEGGFMGAVTDAVMRKG